MSPVKFITRESDGTVKIFDLRKFKEPFDVFLDLDSDFDSE